ncbi:hypothetical protein FRB99_003345 [Tulasnella sp. 403]|nr:hypothetical protein FRB99_003345 [Tulasnella sp. 403]
MTKPSLATIGTWIETGVTKFIAGEGEEGSIGSGNSETAKQDGSNAAAGPFSQYAVISSAQTSPNASSLNLAANSPTNGLAPPPASHKALRRSGSALAVRAQPSSLTPIDRAASAMDMRPDPRSPYGGGPQIFSANAATTSFYPSTPSYSQSEATDETVTGDSEKPSSGNWWDSSTSLDDGSKTTPTATFYSIGSTSEETGDFVSPMDTPLPPASRAASYSSTSRSTSVAPVEEEDEDDLGLGNNSSKKKRTPPAKTEDSEETKPAPNGDAAKPAPAPANPPTTPKPASNPESRSSGSWLPWRWGKKEEAAPTGGPVRAKLGEENSFYYDKELKRWVNKKAGGDATPAAAPLPPPPSRVPSRAQTTSPSTAAPPATLPRGVTPPPRPQSSISAMATNGKTLQPKRSHLAESYTPSSEPLSAPPTMATAPPPFSRIADPDLVPPPLSARSSAAAKRKGKSRYVDVFQQEQAS